MVMRLGWAAAAGLRCGLRRRAQQRLRARQEHVAGLGQPGALRRAVQQAHAQLLLQAPDLPAQRRLRDAQSGGCATEMSVLGHHDEVPDQP